MATLRIAVRRFDPFESAIRHQLADFARAAGWDARAELEPLELNDLHRLFAQRGLADGSLDCYGTALARFPDGHNDFYDFCIQVWSRGGEPFDAGGRPQLCSRAAAEALEFLRRLAGDAAAIAPGARDLDSVKAGLLFCEGRVALADISHVIDDLLAQATGTSLPVERLLREAQGRIERVIA